MFDWLLTWDYRIFHAINQEWVRPWMTSIIPLLRNKWIWIPVYAFLATLIIEKHRWKSIWIFLAVLGGVGMTDFIVSRVLKPAIGRLRPCQMMDSLEVIIRVPCGVGFSFPSAHGANHFFLAVVIGSVVARDYPWLAMLLWLWAGGVAYAQVFVGVHFPLDVIGGALLGIFVGVLIVRFVMYPIIERHRWESLSS